ncbi:MAG: RNA-binding protein [Lachnospiraceae bacterium]|nr:RNA-binding protein [Lachnospiraceae bacterium]
MLEVGRYKNLTVEKKVEFGVYLNESGAKGEEHVLLPAAQVPEGVGPGDEIRVFIYRDSRDRLIATTNKPAISMGEVAPLKVKEVTKVGGFLDWGLEKDLFLPYAEMTKKPKAGDTILVRMYADKSDRLCASMKHVYEELSTRSPYNAGDEVTGRIYEFGHDFGTFVAVDDKFSAMIPRHENVENLRIGDVINARVTRVLEDGKLDLSLREKSYIQMEDDAEAVMSLIEAYAGVLPFSEKASPEVIMRETGLSKAAFKRAVGRLYKERRIDLSDGRIRKI